MSDEPITLATEAEAPAAFRDLLPVAGALFVGQVVLVAVLYVVARALAKAKTRKDNLIPFWNEK